MGKETHTSEGKQIGRTDEKVDLRKHKKRLTTFEEKQEIMEHREKYKEEDLKDKMQRVTDIQNEVVKPKKKN